jgi:hypothetical protein
MGLHVDWEAGTATVEFDPVDLEPVTLQASGLRLLRVPRENPWGPSASVNTAELRTSEDGRGLRLWIEMQSGDEIELDADAVELI